MLTIRSRVTTSSFHPLTWWLWAVLLATTLLLANTRAISVAIVTSTLVLALSMQRQTAGFHTFRWALRFAVIAFCFRMFIAIFIGVPMPGRTIFTLPQLQLPDFLVGIRIGGQVTTQRLLSGFDEAVLLVALILIFATANALSNPIACSEFCHNVFMVLVLQVSFPPPLRHKQLEELREFVALDDFADRVHTEFARGAEWRFRYWKIP